MKIIENVTLYECEHCSRKMRRKGDMTRHEKNCKSNPDNMDACLMCFYSKKEDLEYSVYFEEADCFVKKKSHAYRCGKFDKLMFPFKAEKYAKKYPEQFKNQQRMPTECESFGF